MQIGFAQPVRTASEFARRCRVAAAVTPEGGRVAIGFSAEELRIWARVAEHMDTAPAVLVVEVEREPHWMLEISIASAAASAAYLVLSDAAHIVAAYLTGVL